MILPGNEFLKYFNQDFLFIYDVTEHNCAVYVKHHINQFKFY